MEEFPSPVGQESEGDHSKPAELAQDAFDALSPIKAEKAPRMKRSGGSGRLKPPKAARSFLHMSRHGRRP